MPRFYMHLVDRTDVLIDPDGVEILAEHVASAALLQARDCMAGDVKAGRLDLHCRIDVHDADGQLVHRLPFEEALDIASPPDAGD